VGQPYRRAYVVYGIRRDHHRFKSSEITLNFRQTPEARLHRLHCC